MTDTADESQRREARDRRTALLLAAGFTPLLAHLSKVASEQHITAEAAWLALRGQLCSGAVTAYIVTFEVPVPVPKRRWYSAATAEVGVTGKLVLSPGWASAVRTAWGESHDGVMNRPNLNPGAINMGAIDASGRLKIPAEAGKADYDPLRGLHGTFTVFLELSRATADRKPVTDMLAVADLPGESTSTNAGRPPRKGHDEFWIEAARLAFVGAQGKEGQTQCEFFDAMEAWSQKHMRQPYRRDSIEAKITKLWQVLRLGKDP